MGKPVLKVGVIGLSRAFTLMLPTFTLDSRVRLVAAADPRQEARAAFAAEFGARTYADANDLCADSDVDLVYVASPHQWHAAHVACAAENGKHVLVEKPMAISLAECRIMIDAARKAGVHLMVGHSHSFDLPILHARSLIESGAFGAVRMMTAFNYTDFLYRPRRPEELDTQQGGGVIFSQGAHQIDVVRLIGGGMVQSVRAATGNWDAARPTEGAFSALLTFANGAHATVVYSGYGHFDSDELMGWIGELGQPRDPEDYGAARRALQRGDTEAALKNARAYGSGGHGRTSPPPVAHQHFGTLLISCERGDLRPLPNGVMIYADQDRRLDPLPAPTIPRKEVIDEVYATVVDGRPPLHNGEWSLATLEVCLAILESARTGRDAAVTQQVSATRIGPT